MVHSEAGVYQSLDDIVSKNGSVIQDSNRSLHSVFNMMYKNSDNYTASKLAALQNCTKFKSDLPAVGRFMWFLFLKAIMPYDCIDLIKLHSLWQYVQQYDHFQFSTVCSAENTL